MLYAVRPMARGIIVLHRSSEVQRAVAAFLRPTLRPVLLAGSPMEARLALADSAVPVELAVVDHSLLLEAPDLLDELISAGTSACVLAVGPEAPGSPPVSIIRGFDTFALSSLAAQGPPRQIDELAVTALKLLRRDLFGMEKYLAWGCEPVTHYITSTSERRELQNALATDLADRGFGSRLRWLACQAADELVSNSVFHGPVDAAGRHLRADRARTDEFSLGDNERVSVRWASDDRYFALEVVDGWGSIDIATLARSMRLAVTPPLTPRLEGHGAGIGLALTACSVHHLACNLEPGRRTELIALLDIRGATVRLEMAPSFHAFVTGLSA
jgi:hypothetical protein